MKSKKGEILNRVMIHIILIGLIFALFITATADKVNARGVRQQVVEKQLALLIDSGVPGMSFEFERENLNGVIQDIRIENSKVFVDLDGLPSIEGYPYFTLHSVRLEKEDTFRVSIVPDEE